MNTSVPINLIYCLYMYVCMYVVLCLAASGNTPCGDPLRLTSYDDNYICVCTSGWTGLHCSIDVDECSSGECDTNAVCTNTVGSFNCSTCNPGYYISGYLVNGYVCSGMLSYMYIQLL